jgi:hypothetical protein
MNGISGAVANTYILAKALAVAIAIVAGAAAVLRCDRLSRNRASYYDVRSYGARGAGLGKDTAALHAAIDAAASHAGGTVIVTDRGTCEGVSGCAAHDRSPRAPLAGSRLAVRESTHTDRAPKPAGGIRVHPRLGS